MWGYTSHMGYTPYYEGIPTHMEAHPSTGHPLIMRVYPPTWRHTRIRGYTPIWDIPLLWVYVPTCGYTPHVRGTVPYGIYPHKEGTLSYGVNIPIRVWTYSTLFEIKLGIVGMPPPRHSRHAAPRVCRGMDELRVSAIDTLAQISHTMASQVDPIAKLRRIAAVTAIHTDMMYSALGAPAARKPSVVLAIGAAPAVEDFDDEVEEADEAWPDDEADEARPATGGAGDVYCP